MIRCSVNSDKEGIITLWNEAFGDNRKEIEFFLDNKYNSENTVVYEENCEIISQLFLLEGNMHINGVDYPSYYLYAACTSKKHRGRGIMGKMLEFSKKIALERGINFICLMPAEESLFDFYSKFGYKSIFKRKTVKISSEDIKDIQLFQESFSDFSNKPSYRIRDERFENINYFKWDKSSVDFAFEHIKMYGGQVFQSRKGYCLYTISDSALSVKETTFTQSDLMNFIKNLINTHKIKSIELILPPDYTFFSFDGMISYNGMILPLIDKTINDAYLGLTLD